MTPFYVAVLRGTPVLRSVVLPVDKYSGYMRFIHAVHNMLAIAESESRTDDGWTMIRTGNQNQDHL